LLNAEEEQSLSRQYRLYRGIEAMARDLERKLGRSVLTHEVATHLNMTDTYLNSVMKNGQAAFDRMCFSNVKLVMHICSVYKNMGVSIENLMQEGMRGLEKAVDKFNPELGNRFSTYASWWIRMAASRAVSNNVHRVGYELLPHIYRAKAEFRQENDGKEPSLQQLSERLAIPEDRIDTALKSRVVVENLDEQVYKNRGKGGRRMSKLDNLAYVDPNIAKSERALAQQDARVHLITAIEKMPSKEGAVMKLIYGLDGQPEMPLPAVAKVMGLSKEKVKQLEQRAIQRLKMDPTCQTKPIFNA
jgi:RNA polymerase sigma factor (sigma-70 family)